MKQTLTAILIGICFSTILKAQETPTAVERKGYIGLSLGATFPTGDFGDDNFQNSKAGLAKTGLNIVLADFGYKIGKNFGIAAIWSGAACPVDAQLIANQFAMYGNTTVEATSWSVGNLLVGPLVSIPFRKIDFDIRLMMGLSTGNTPKMTVNVTGFPEIRQESASASALGVDIGTGIRFHVAEKISLMAHIDYFSVEPEFKITATNTAGAINTVTTKQRMSMLNTNVGVAFRIK